MGYDSKKVHSEANAMEMCNYGSVKLLAKFVIEETFTDDIETGKKVQSCVHVDSGYVECELAIHNWEGYTDSKGNVYKDPLDAIYNSLAEKAKVDILILEQFPTLPVFIEAESTLCVNVNSINPNKNTYGYEILNSLNPENPGNTLRFTMVIDSAEYN